MSGEASAAINAAFRRWPAERIASATTRQSAVGTRQLHTLVVRAAAPLGRYPVDDLVRINDVARLAVDAVRGVDLELPRPVAGIDHLVHVRRAEPDARVAVLG